MSFLKKFFLNLRNNMKEVPLSTNTDSCHEKQDILALEQQAKQGNIIAQRELGELYEEGNSVPQNYEKLNSKIGTTTNI